MTILELIKVLCVWYNVSEAELAKRGGGKIEILLDMKEDVHNILCNVPHFVDCPEQHEFFQRKYGIDPKHGHYNRMSYNYIAGGFGSNIDKQLNNIVLATEVNGSAMSASNLIKMVEQPEEKP